MDAVEAYLRKMWEIRSTGGGVAGTSYYPTLCNLLNEIGDELRPKAKQKCK